ncbi:hypothetical protein, partial [Escherichia coli]|uniref:hypothetical protein n=1 Tax=Escherichia coli TaxID=562 RepID=UPI002899EDCA
DSSSLLILMRACASLAFAILRPPFLLPRLESLVSDHAYERTPAPEFRSLRLRNDVRDLLLNAEVA